MTPRSGVLEGVLWATRGRTWGFRFLLDGGLTDPLPLYERAFSPLRDERTGHAEITDGVVVRFPDPEGRHDFSGRPIPHDFVVTGELRTAIGSVEDALAILWPLVADVYARVWEGDSSPTRANLEFDGPA